MKIMAVCGSGLGSSFLLEMNVQSILKDLEVDGVEVEHTDFSSVTPASADIFVVSLDLSEGLSGYNDVIVLQNIIDKEELKEKLVVVLKEKGII